MAGERFFKPGRIREIALAQGFYIDWFARRVLEIGSDRATALVEHQNEITDPVQLYVSIENRRHVLHIHTTDDVLYRERLNVAVTLLVLRGDTHT